MCEMEIYISSEKDDILWKNKKGLISC